MKGIGKTVWNGGYVNIYQSSNRRTSLVPAPEVIPQRREQTNSHLRESATRLGPGDWNKDGGEKVLAATVI